MTTFNERCVCGDELSEHRTASLQCQKSWPNHWRADEPTVTLDELKQGAHELNDFIERPRMRENPNLLADLGLGLEE